MIKNTFFLFLFYSFNVAYSQCLEGDCINGFGLFKCDCGYVFEGEFENGQKIYGTLTKEDLVYTGAFKNDVAEGKGVIHFKDSTWYEGDFVNNLPQGRGIFHFPDATTYVGELQEGNFTGFGVMTYYTDSGSVASYKMGTFAQDEMVDFGVIVQPNVGWYLGEFQSNKKSGFGIIYLPLEAMEIGKFRKNKHIRIFGSISSDSVDESGVIMDSKTKFKVKSTGNGIFVISIVNAANEIRVICFDHLRETLFSTTFQSYPKGMAITRKGEIESAIYDLNSTNFIIEISPLNEE